ncbi:hypothetical protein [Pseudomonas citronellolis]|uniref:hypothetical protein n=1 Tax=Pseudomonas citronellolis TaxID=53408 RepID=UPI0021BF981C|nr:hypothetical protein [Pseudomonas citronellolis]UXJ54873.1 hypothetical protein N5P21_11955 [Pseudomonas citronellolis]
MGVLVRMVDPAAAHLKRRAYQLGERVRAKGGGLVTEVMDGFIARAQGSSATVVVTLFSAPWQIASPVPNIISGYGLVRDVRFPHPLNRFTLDQAAAPNGLTQLPVDADSFRPYHGGVAVSAGAPFPSVTAGSWTTTDPTPQGFVINVPMVRSGSSGSFWLIDFVLYRDTAGRRVLEADATGYDVEFRSAAPVTTGELAYVLFSAGAVGFSPGTPALPNFGYAPVATELEPGQGIIGMATSVRVSSTEMQIDGRFLRYQVNPQDASVAVLWRHAESGFVPQKLYAAANGIRALGQTDASARLLSFTADGFQGGQDLFSLEDDGFLYNPVAYEVAERPWFFACRRRVPDLEDMQQQWTGLEDLDAVLISPDGAVVQVSTPGYYVQRGCSRVDQAGTGPDDGDLAEPGSDVEHRRYRYGMGTFAEFTPAMACRYAPEMLVVVVSPEGAWEDDRQPRYLAFVHAVTGALIRISPAPVANGDIWTAVSVSCVEQAVVDEAGQIVQEGVLLVSSWRQYVEGLDDGPPNPADIGVWVTADGGATLQVLYQREEYSPVQAVSQATYLGGLTLPAQIGVTRRQWISGRAGTP